jgi:hypothetical protein
MQTKSRRDDIFVANIDSSPPKPRMGDIFVEDMFEEDIIIVPYFMILCQIKKNPCSSF